MWEAYFTGQNGVVENDHDFQIKMDEKVMETQLDTVGVKSTKCGSN